MTAGSTALVNDVVVNRVLDYAWGFGPDKCGTHPGSFGSLFQYVGEYSPSRYVWKLVYVRSSRGRGGGVSSN
jgi:hypothetical protein